jgi:hypothetical protein
MSACVLSIRFSSSEHVTFTWTTWGEVLHNVLKSCIQFYYERDNSIFPPSRLSPPWKNNKLAFTASLLYFAVIFLSTLPRTEKPNSHETIVKVSLKVSAMQMILRSARWTRPRWLHLYSTMNTNVMALLDPIPAWTAGDGLWWGFSQIKLILQVGFVVF